MGSTPVLAPHHVLKEACVGCAAPRAGPQIPDCPPAAPPRRQGLPRLPKKGLYQGTAVFFKEPQVATFLTTLPHARSPALRCYSCLKAATQRPDWEHWEDGKGPSSPAAGSAQPAAIFQNGQKTPKKAKAPKAPPALAEGRVRGSAPPQRSSPLPIARSRGSSRAAVP